ncbi:hypothetical protein SAMN05216486_10489 [bacterium JGI 053]|nr:hypothetical protein SAMN05216486_10489 [bacterium JGI 053]
MAWNYVATFTGTWSIANLPAGAVDKSNTLWVMYGDEGQNSALTYFSEPIPHDGKLSPVDPTRLSQRTADSPCLVPVHGQLVTLWSSITDQKLLWGVLDAKTKSLSEHSLSSTRAGALAAFFPETDCLFTAFRGDTPSQSFRGNFPLLYCDVIGPDTPQPQTRTPMDFSASAPNAPGLYDAYYSPAVAAMPAGAASPGGEIAVLWKGIGSPGAESSDNELYFVSAPDPLKPVFPGTGLLRYPGPGGAPTTATTMNRPSLALHGTGKTPATLVAVYSGTATGSSYKASGQLRYLVGTLTRSGVTWAAPLPNGTVPLGALLANAAPGGGAVTLTNPVGVWVTAPTPSNTLYLLVGDQVDGRIKGPLYVVRYMGEL